MPSFGSGLAGSIGDKDKVQKDFYARNPGALERDKLKNPGKYAPSLQQQQADYAKQFRSEIPNLQNKMAAQLSSEAGNQLNQDLGAIRTKNSSRGLLYGGLNQGNEASQRAESKRGLMSGISNINTGLENAANQMDQAAIQTGMGAQAQGQAIQNMIYQNAMARQAGQNQITGSIIGAGLSAALL